PRVAPRRRAAGPRPLLRRDVRPPARRPGDPRGPAHRPHDVLVRPGLDAGADAGHGADVRPRRDGARTGGGRWGAGAAEGGGRGRTLSAGGHRRVKLRGLLERTASTVEVRSDGALVVELYDFSPNAHAWFGNDVAFLLTVAAGE